MAQAPKETPLQVWDRIRHGLGEELQRKMGQDFQAIADALRHHDEGQRLVESAARPEEGERDRPREENAAGRRGNPPTGRTSA